MQVPTRGEPRFVDEILDWRWTWPLARLALVSAYLIGAVVKLADWPAAVAEQAHFGMHPAAGWAALTVTTEATGALLVLTNRPGWLGAGMLATFTMLAACVANSFWALHGPERLATANAFFEHLGLLGGFVAVAMVDRRSRPVRRG